MVEKVEGHWKMVLFTLELVFCDVEWVREYRVLSS
jgi:hypothetical protein